MSPARSAREALGLPLAVAARRARISTAYLRRIEMQGAGWSLARRLAHIYGCSIDVFLPTPTGGGTPHSRMGGAAVAHPRSRRGSVNG